MWQQRSPTTSMTPGATSTTLSRRCRPRPRSAAASDSANPTTRGSRHDPRTLWSRGGLRRQPANRRGACHPHRKDQPVTRSEIPSVDQYLTRNRDSRIAARTDAVIAYDALGCQVGALYAAEVADRIDPIRRGRAHHWAVTIGTAGWS